MTDAAVDCEHLGRRFGRRVALADVSFSVRPGELLGVVGADGSGKTTLLQMLAAILDPSDGRATVLGWNTVEHAAEVTARIGYMSQGFTLYERLTVGENIAFAAAVRDVDATTLATRLPRLLRMAGLEPFVDRRAMHLSGGMRKKLALCTNLVHEPRLLLLDEPSLGVDPLSRRELWDLLFRFRSQGMTLVVATSYMDEAERCDRVAFLHGGRLLALDPPAALRQRARGAVYEWPGASDEEEQRLGGVAAVINVKRLPGRLRFQVDAIQWPSHRFDGDASVRAADPTLEDLFALLAPREPQAALLRPPIRDARPQPGPVIDVAGLSCAFGAFRAVDNVELTVSPGEIFGFLGPNGAGKTTLIRILCGLQRFQRGTVHVAGIDVARDSASLRARIGYMSQRFSLYSDLTVAENLDFFARIYALGGVARETAMARAIASAGLDGLAAEYVATISGATRQRLALACAVMHGPAVIFLDEPTSGVDPLSRHRFWRLVHALASHGVAAFVTTHYLEEAAYCHRLGLMYQGRLLGTGTPDALRAQFGLSPSDNIEAIFMAGVQEATRTIASAA